MTLYRLLPRDATQSAVIRLHVVCLSVWFLQRVSIALAMQSAVLAMIDSVWPSDRLTVW